MIKKIIREFLRLLLKLHNFSYHLAGRISRNIEPNGLHPKHRLLDYHQWFIEQIKPHWSILDVGCGNGALAADLTRHCKSVLGIDLSEENVRQARNRSDAEFVCGDATTHCFGKRFDAITLSNVLEHIENRVEFLKRLRQYSDIFLIRVPMLDRDWITLYKKELGIEYRLDPTHFTEYTLESLCQELSEAGLRVESYRIRYGEIYAVARTV